MVTDETYQNRYSYTGLGDYEVSFAYDITDNLIVEWISDDGVLEEKVVGVDYNITSAGAVVSCTVILSFGIGGDIIIRREMPLTQTWRGVDGTTPAPTGIMQAMDRLAWIMQQINGLIANAVKAPANESLDMTIPTVVERAKRVLGFDSTGRPVTVTELPEVDVTPWAETLLDDTSASEGRETLGVGMDRHVITTNTTLEVNKSYLINADVELSLPATASVGDVIDILSDGYPKIVQNDLQHSITYKGKYRTTKGTTGFIQMFDKEHIQLTYKGTGLSQIEPGVKLPDPATLPGGEAHDISFSFDGVYLAVAHLVTPYITIYKRTGDTFLKLTNPATIPTDSCKSIEFSKDGTYLAVGSDLTPWLRIYKRSGDTFTLLTPPATAPTNDVDSLAFSNNGVYMAVGSSAYPYLYIYKRTGDTFTKLADVVVVPPGAVASLDFSYDDDYLAVGTSYSGIGAAVVYKRSGDVFTKITDPPNGPDGVTGGTSFSRDGRFLAFMHFNSPWLAVYERSVDAFTRLSDPASLPVSQGIGGDFSHDGKYLAVSSGATPFIQVYRREGSTFTLLSNPSTLPTSVMWDAKFSGDGTYLACVVSLTPFIVIYKMKESVTKQWIATDFEVMNPDTPSADGDLKYRFK